MSCHGNLVGREERALEALATRRERLAAHACAIRDVQLSDVRQFELAVRREDLDVGASLLGGLTSGPVGHRLVEFEESGGDRPLAVGRLDRAAAEQDLSVPFDQAADHDQRVDVVHPFARSADRTFPIVVIRNAAGHRIAAIAAELHARIVATRCWRVHPGSGQDIIG